MERDAADVLRDALRLPPEARAALVDSLIESLDQKIEGRRSRRVTERFRDALESAMDQLLR